MNGYGQYMRKENMDRNKFELLLALADENPTLPDFLFRLEQLKAITANEKAGTEEGIILTTAHSSKGLEYDTVYLMDVYDGQFPCTSLWETDGRKSDMDVLQEERRLFYVAMTRAKNHLYVLKIKGKQSSFVDEILPPPEPPKPKASDKPHYSIDRVQREYAQRFQQQEEEKRRLHEAVLKAAAERYQQGLQEVMGKAFDTEDFVEDSFGRRWLKCERCSAVKQKDEFSLVGRRNRPSIGICAECARKME